VRLLDTPHLVLQRQPVESMRIVEEFVLRAAAGAAPAVTVPC
jgi:hypothetical protein